jgi:hypothetical protein
MKFMAKRVHLQHNMDLEPQWGVLVFSLFKKFDFTRYEGREMYAENQSPRFSQTQNTGQFIILSAICNFNKQ